MAIINNPVANTDAIIEHFQNGIRTVEYVCTTDVYQVETDETLFCDVFVQWPRHEAYGNQYFGFYRDEGGNGMICNADEVENYIFGMVENDDGDLVYSANTNDYQVFNNGNWIDGGRDTIQFNGDVHYYKLANGDFYEVRLDD
jgi:hypothetical protein